MKKKIVVCCLFVVMTLLVLPIMSANSTFKEQPTVQNIGAEKQGCMVQEKPDARYGIPAHPSVSSKLSVIPYAGFSLSTASSANAHRLSYSLPLPW